MRNSRSYSRRGPTKEPYDSVLIVCEGGKSEPYYLNRLRDVYRLSSANIKITPADGTDPMTVVAYAEGLAAQDRYDRVCCVFDRDRHDNYDAALAKTAHCGFHAITSWPCFEFWILLHFRYSSAPLNSEQALAAVVKEYPKYAKGHKTVFDDLNDRLPSALKHGERLHTENIKNGSRNPATKMHELVQYLMKLKS
jgi:RloB-like protein